MTLLCGAGCAGAHAEVVALAKQLKAPRSTCSLHMDLEALRLLMFRNRSMNPTFKAIS